MVTLAVAGDAEFKDQVAGELAASDAVVPPRVTLLPRNCIAEVASEVCCSEIRVCRLAFILICCSTEENSTSCWVNWLVSSGSSGFWFCNCVVSNVRKVLKLPASCCDPTAPAAVAVEEVELVVGVLVVEVGVVVVVMVRPQGKGLTPGCRCRRRSRRGHRSAASRSALVRGR